MASMMDSTHEPTTLESIWHISWSVDSSRT